MPIVIYRVTARMFTVAFRAALYAVGLDGEQVALAVLKVHIGYWWSQILIDK
jgi:hypothetical protein